VKKYYVPFRELQDRKTAKRRKRAWWSLGLLVAALLYLVLQAVRP
jgi:hypothetical protein